MKDLRGLKNLKNLELSELSEKYADSTIAGKKYVEGYEVIHNYPLTEENSKLLVDEIMNKKNYVQEARRCKMQPRYAINAEEKLVLLFELEDCPGLVYYRGDTTLRLNVATENTIKNVIEKIKASNK